jgi:hypothetical protein
MSLSELNSLRLAAALIGFAAVAAFSAACSDCPSACPGTALPPASAGASESSNSPEDVARRAVQALIDDDISGLLSEVRPDIRTNEREAIEQAIEYQVKAVRGCRMGNVLVPENVLGVGEYVSVTFGQPCGDSGDTTKCELKMVKLSGQFYLESYVFYCG